MTKKLRKFSQGILERGAIAQAEFGLKIRADSPAKFLKGIHAKISRNSLITNSVSKQRLLLYSLDCSGERPDPKKYPKNQFGGLS